MNIDKPLLIQTGKGLTIKYLNKYLYSKYEPIKQSERLLNSIQLKENTIYFIPSPLLKYGFNLLVHNLPKTSKLLCIEVDKNLYDFVPDPDSDSKIYYSKDGFELINILSNVSFTNIKKCELLSVNSAYSINKNQYDALFKILLNYLHNYWKNRYTITQMGRLWIKNMFKNIFNINESFHISYLKTTKPVIVIGAGESVESILKPLKKIINSVFILCVDTALQVLIEEDIMPNAVIALEAQFYNLPDFYAAKDLNIPLIYDLSSYPAVTRNIIGKKYYTITKFSDSLILKKIEKTAPNLSMIPPLGSVGITALKIALEISENNIYLAGLDFSYKLGKTHSKGTPYHISSLISWNRINSGYSYAQCIKRPIFFKINKNGQLENTDKILYEYSLQAKEILFNCKRVYDLTKTGMILDIPQVDIESITFNTKINNSNLRLTNYSYILKDLLDVEICKINNAHKLIQSKLKSNSLLSVKEIEILKEVHYIFDFFPDTNIFQNLNIINLKRVYYELCRFKKSCGL